MEKDMTCDRKKILVLKANNNKKPTLKFYRNSVGTDCLWSLSTAHELKQSVRKLKQTVRKKLK